MATRHERVTIQVCRNERLVREYRALWEKYNLGAYRLALQLCRNHARAEDAVSAAFEAVFPYWCDGRVRNFWPYFRTTLVRTLSRPERELPQDPPDQIDPKPDPCDLYALKDVLLRALDRLSDQERAVLVLRYFEDLSAPQTARLLGITPGTVRSHASRGLAKLRDWDTLKDWNR